MMTSRTRDDFCDELATRGIEAALAFLNAGVAHRYTAAYRIDGAVMRNVAAHDKAGGPRPAVLEHVPFEMSFSQYVLRDGQFRTDDSARDCRLAGHPYRGILVSYQGVTVLDPAGHAWGTLCHFDLASLTIPDSEFQLLVQAGRCLLTTPGFEA